MKPIFHLRNLHLGHVATSFCLRDVPTQISRHQAPSTGASNEGSSEKVGNGLNKKVDKRKFNDQVESYARRGNAKLDQQLASEFNSGSALDFYMVKASRKRIKTT
jgi:hypothetical protein